MDAREEMSRRHDDHLPSRRLARWLADPWRQTDLVVFGLIAPAVTLIWIWSP
jgi:hypothetical protein